MNKPMKWNSYAGVVLVASFVTPSAFGEAPIGDLREGSPPVATFQDCDICPVMAVVPPGSFQMGSPATELAHMEEESPIHTVTLAKPFALGIYEVTFDEFDACYEADGCDDSPPTTGWMTKLGVGEGVAQSEDWKRGKRPVIKVSWNDAREYVEWLAEHTGKPYRLASEAEWEYAARAGTATPFYFGETISTDQANYRGTHVYGNGSRGVFRGRTVDVGSFAPNAFGLHDMHGNVWEWVEDCWHENYQNAPADGSAWRTPRCRKRVLRSGGWANSPDGLRSAMRIPNGAGINSDIVGFRVARSLSPQEIDEYASRLEPSSDQ